MRTDERLKKISDDIINDITKTYPPTVDGYIIIKPEQIEVSIKFVLNKFKKELRSNGSQ